MNFKFPFNIKFKNITQWAIISLVLTPLIAVLHHCSGVSEKIIWELVDEIQREFIKNKVKVPEKLNDYIIKTPHLLERRIKRDVDVAIDNYEKEEQRLYRPNMKNEDILREIQKPKYTETQRQIINDAVYYECSDGTMGIHAIWHNSKECDY